jgi:integrase
MMDYVLSSTLAEEIEDYIALRKAGGCKFSFETRILTNFDRFLAQEQFAGKTIEHDLVLRWLAQRPIAARTKNCRISTIRVFASYLRTLGIEVFVPEPVKAAETYVPFLFTEEELTRVFSAVDSLAVSKGVLADVAPLMPLLMRLLYGTGARIGEALCLTWQDVDLERGVLLVRHAKNDCQRFVPLSLSITRILACYRASGLCESTDEGALFTAANGEPLNYSRALKLFRMSLKAAGIVSERKEPGKRGICPHCLRHLFTVHSYQKMEKEGRPFIESSPYLSTYLGHKDLRCTDKYLKSSYVLHINEHIKIEAATSYVFPEVRSHE